MKEDIPDSNLMRLQYEILNKTPHELSASTGLPLSIIESTIKDEGWHQWWPEPSIYEQLETSKSLSNSDPDVVITDEELFVSQADQYIDRTRKRLQVYSLAKETYLAQKYTQLETSIINSAINALSNLEATDTSGIRAMSALYKEMFSKNSGAILSAAVDENGLPSVVIRDLSGR